MTNLVAVVVVCIVTNVTQEIGEPCPGCAVWSMRQGNVITPGHEYTCPEKDLPRDTKRETTEVIEVLTIKIDPEQLRNLGWVGGLIEGEQKRVLSRKVKQWKRKDKWVEE
jgi:hypothetical protein